MAALIQTAAERGLAGTTVSEVCRRAGVSARCFRGEFSTIEDCLVATFESQIQAAAARMVSSYRASAGEISHDANRLALALDTLMHLIVTGRAAARLCVVEVRSAGPDALASHERAMWYLARLLASARPEIADDLELARALAGGVWQVIHNRLVRERVEELPGLVVDLSLWIAQYTEPYPAPRSRATAGGRANPEGSGTAVHTDDREDLRDRLLHATATLARSTSYSALSTRAIANRADCSISTFYRYFSTKQQAALAVYDKWVANRLPPGHNVGQKTSDFASIRTLLANLGNSLEAEPDAAYLAFIAVFALGSVGHERHLQTLLGFERLLRDASCDESISSIATEATAGALWETLYSHMFNESHIPDLQAKLAFLLFTPLVGSERAGTLARDI